MSREPRAQTRCAERVGLAGTALPTRDDTLAADVVFLGHGGGIEQAALLPGRRCYTESC
ncbi:hypothetical protein [Nocardia sp. NPDC060249]|uniref:hypothetical protein n=1 Tax=Nocardia sp. NPDC060249 TaxID=3347082 RepID=UPI00365991CD